MQIMKHRIITSVIALSLLATVPAWGQTSVIRRGQTEAERQAQVARQRQQAAERAWEEEAKKRKEQRDSIEQANKAKRDSIDKEDKAAIAKGEQMKLDKCHSNIIAKGLQRYYDFEGFSVLLNKDEGTAKIVAGMEKAKGSIVIPERLKSDDGKYYTVNAIGSNAFRGCKELTSIKMPASLDSIGAVAFQDCFDLREIELPTGVRSIDHSAFSGCHFSSIRMAAEGECYVVIDNVLYDRNQTKLIKCSCDHQPFTVPPTVEEIVSRAFDGCNRLTSIQLPSSLHKIGNSAFRWSGLVSINIPASVKEIGAGAFLLCRDLSSVSLPPSLKEISSGLFESCINLTTIQIPKGVKKVGDNAFFNCKSLAAITIPASVETIGKKVFYDCKNLSSVTLSEELLSTMLNYDYDAYFLGCDKLHKLKITNGSKSRTINRRDIIKR